MAHCRRCETDLMHCHGTLVRHGGGDEECSAQDCPGVVAVHDLVLVCDEVQSGCCRGAVPVGRVAVRRAVRPLVRPRTRSA